MFCNLFLGSQEPSHSHTGGSDYADGLDASNKSKEPDIM